MRLPPKTVSAKKKIIKNKSSVKRKRMKEMSCTSPTIILMVELLPALFLPKRPKHSPDPTWKETFETASRRVAAGSAVGGDGEEEEEEGRVLGG
jgi:hypothetical protein